MARLFALTTAAAIVGARSQDVCGSFREAWRRTFTPVSVSSKALIIGAGHGTTGTYSIAKWVSSSSDPPLNVGHYNATYPGGSLIEKQRWDAIHHKLMTLSVPRTVNGTGHTCPSRFCATSP